MNLLLCYYKFPNASVSSEKWCYLNDVSYGIIVLLFSLLWPIQVCAAEHKFLYEY